MVIVDFTEYGWFLFVSYYKDIISKFHEPGFDVPRTHFFGWYFTTFQGDLNPCFFLKIGFLAHWGFKCSGSQRQE